MIHKAIDRESVGRNGHRTHLGAPLPDGAFFLKVGSPLGYQSDRERKTGGAEWLCWKEKNFASAQGVSVVRRNSITLLTRVAAIPRPSGDTCG